MHYFKIFMLLFCFLMSVNSCSRFKRAASSEKNAFDHAQMHRFRSSWPYAKYHLGLCSLFIRSVVANSSVSGSEDLNQTARMRRLIGLRCPYMP